MSLYLSLVAIGVGELGKNPIFQSVVTLFGSIYLFRISYLIYNDESKLEEDEEFSFRSENWFSIYKKAILIHLSNPKALIFFTVVITPFLTKSVFISVLSLFLGIFSAFILAGFISSKIPITSKMMRFINRTSSVMFLFFSITFLYRFIKLSLNLL